MFKNGIKILVFRCVGMLAILSVIGSMASGEEIQKAASDNKKPVAYWSFDEVKDNITIVDVTGNGYDGTVVRSQKIEGPFEVKLQDGIHGKALLCGGAGGQHGYFLEIKNPPELRQSFTVCMWLKPLGSQWLTKLIEQSNSDLTLELTGTILGLRHYYHGHKDTRTLEMKSPIQTGTWYFAAVTWDGTWRLYLNGALMAENTDGEYPPYVYRKDIPLRLGGYNDHTNNIFVGLIDETRIWQRALSAEEIKQVMLADLSE